MFRTLASLGVGTTAFLFLLYRGSAPMVPEEIFDEPCIIPKRNPRMTMRAEASDAYDRGSGAQTGTA